MKKQLIVPGHTLEDEGRIYDAGRLVADGVAFCSCSEASPMLPSASARQRWHKDHKLAIEAKRQTEADAALDQQIRDANPVKENA